MPLRAWTEVLGYMKNVVRALILLALLAALMFAVPSGALMDGALAEGAYPALSLEAEKGGLPLESGYDGLSYRDDTITVTVEETRAYDTTILIARVIISDPSQIRTAMAGRYGSDTQTPGARLAKRVQAVFAINGDYFNFTSNGYVVRQGTLYRDNPAAGSDILLIDDQGDFHIVQDATSEKLAAFDGTVINSFSFGPALVADGEVVEGGFLDDVAYDKPAQRMVVAQAGPLSYVCVATEGPENPGSVGLTIPQMAEFMGTLGVQNAYNLDGGSSSTMVLNNEKINALSTHKVRSICDILYFATLVNQE